MENKEIMERILATLIEIRDDAKTNAKDVNYQLRRVATRLEEMNK